ncbi:cbb3-type cytochrome c oxidase subunit I [Brevundimonas sp. SORGH_AS_0993]|uniref:cbb3-type cytochrome c oxidase subunit I n=1 Tax=Brevundimonas sp. SORGH_AS_0993 TaxID=3041794 RepID=UPI002783236C|nr:cbb3-type cytochrome c oxidase subunit I [Brevundimonas sp. SORGH_AS_0993]MDQ1154172.1 cytochrome c oxidase subunit I+III [Brevundimonas sp. SORGH_AS_0993]
MSSETGFDTELYKRFPTTEARPEGELEQLEDVWCGPRKPWEWITAINNNFVGVYYVGAALLFFVLAGVLALLMRTQLALPMTGFLAQETYNQIFTMHGTVMMFLFAVPAVEALGVLLLPQMLGARDLPFPRLSAYAFWAYLVGGLCFFCSLFFGLAPNGGWFMYPPLTSMTYSPGINADFWLLGIGFIEISAIAGAIEIIVGVLKTRAPGMTLDKLPIFAWAMLIFACMIIIAFPSIILSTLLLELERALGWPFFDAAKGGDPMLWQHLFWFFGHPEVYIIFLPAAGAMSTLIPAVAQTRLVGYRLVVLAMLATGFISFGVWAHHMFTTGMPQISINYFSAASMAVSVPAGVQVFAWIATLAAGRMRFNTPGLFAVGGLVIFVMGGLTGVMVAMVPFDWQAHDSYFIVAHLHYVLIGGMVFPLFAAIYYWLPMSSARPLSERWGRWIFWLMFVGHNVTFLPMHLTGLMGMPRRVYNYLPDRGWDVPNMISTIGAFLFGLAVLLWVVDMVRNFRPFRETHAGNVFGGPGLEWLPSGRYALRSVPVVKSLYPVWDQPDLARDVEAGRYFLPGAPRGERETMITSPISAEPQYLQRMPRPSSWYVWGAIFTAGFFLILTIQAYLASVISGVLALYCILKWCWGLDRPSGPATVDVGGGVRLPTYVSGPSSHGWWAMVITLIVSGMVAIMACFSYVFLWSRRPDLWQAPPEIGALPLTLVLLAAAGLGAWASQGALKLDRPRSAPLAAALMLGATLAAGGAFAAEASAWWNSGLRPDASSQGATVYALLAWQGVFVAIALMMGAFVLLRRLCGLVSPRHPATFELVALFVVFTAVQGTATTLLIRLFPGGGA